MKKVLLTTMLFLTLALAACNGAASASQASSPQESASLAAAAQLAVGTLKLDGTEQAVTGEQASELLVMWQVYLDLAGSDTAAQEEIDGLVNQIQETMTSEQMEAIRAMDLTQQDLFALMQEQGTETGSSQRSSGDTTFTFAPGGGGGPPDGGGGPPADAGMAGGAPPDGGMGGDLGGMDGIGPGSGTDQSAATGQAAGGNQSIPTALVRAVVQYLEGKAAS